MNAEGVFHDGELKAQELAGEAARARQVGRVISDSMAPGSLRFIDQQSMVVVGSVSPEGDVWASVVLGETGLMAATDPRTIELDLSRAFQVSSDPLWDNVQHDPRVGLLMIELATRRRLRVNGRIDRITPDRLAVHVEESYPNCPKYIQRRHLAGVTTEAGSAPATQAGTRVDASIEGTVVGADTMFVASMAPGGGVDASHRGGPPGFVHIVDERTLRIPDYPGNSLFNTLGNFTACPRAGLVFLDFEKSRVLQLVGRPEIRWDMAQPTEDTGGTGRYWDFTVERWLETTLPFRATWDFLDYSPFNPS